MTRPSAALALALALGCTSPAPAGSCAVPSTDPSTYGVCIDFTGAGYDASSVMAACTQAAGNYATGDCAAGVGGVCTFNAGTASEYTNTYDTSGTDAGFDLAGICTGNGGTFSSM